jgi:hypothetical protein
MISVFDCDSKRCRPAPALSRTYRYGISSPDRVGLDFVFCEKLPVWPAIGSGQDPPRASRAIPPAGFRGRCSELRMDGSLGVPESRGGRIA